MDIKARVCVITHYYQCFKNNQIFPCKEKYSFFLWRLYQEGQTPRVKADWLERAMTAPVPCKSARTQMAAVNKGTSCCTRARIAMITPAS